MERTASIASSRVWAMITPLPKARPSALITVGIGASCRYARAASILVKTSYAAVGSVSLAEKIAQLEGEIADIKTKLT
jgi:hypothetical protein